MECLSFVIFDGNPAVFLAELRIGRNPECVVIGIFLNVIPLVIVCWFWEKELWLALLSSKIDEPYSGTVGYEERVFLRVECWHRGAAKSPTVCFLESAYVILHDAPFESCWCIEI